MQQPTDTPKLSDAYAESLPVSRALYDRAKEVFPDGVTHDNRRMQPFPIYIERAEGAYKWDVDGNRYIDYWMGHGALLFGHNPPPHPRRRERGRTPGLALRGRPQAGGGMGRMGAASRALRRAGALYGFWHRGHTYGAEARARLHRQKARGEIRGPFSRLARGARDRRARPYTNEPEAGQLEEVTDLVTVCPPDDLEAVRGALASGEVAALILEPTGGHFGTIPMNGDFVAALREETRKAGTLLIFDEVVSGFRVSPGGAQAHLGVTPDLTSLAKVLAGGLPGGAVVGRADVMEYLATKPDPEVNRHTKIAHHGTFNANPISAAAGCAMLSSLADGRATKEVNAQAQKLRAGMNEILAQEAVAWKVYGEYSDWKIFFDADAPPRDGADQDVSGIDWRRLDSKNAQKSRALRQALILHGVDFNGARALVGTCHTDDVIEETLAAFRAGVQTMKEEGIA